MCGFLMWVGGVVVVSFSLLMLFILIGAIYAIMNERHELREMERVIDWPSKPQPMLWTYEVSTTTTTTLPKRGLHEVSAGERN
jgi:hypothetical protein